MSADPPGYPTSYERIRQWITDVEVTPGSSEPNCKFSARLFMNEELVCNLPAIDSTRPLRWSGLLCCAVSYASAISLRLCKSIAGRPRYFNFPHVLVSDVDEGTGEVTLELPEAAWVVTIKLLTRTMAHTSNLDLDTTAKYLFKNALNFANLAVQTLPECIAKVSLLIYMKAWELLDQQNQLDETVQAILRGLTDIGDIVDIASQASGAILATAMSRSKKSIQGILTLLEDTSVYIFNQLATNDLAPVPLGEAGLDQSFDVETYLSRLKDLKTLFHASWLPMAATPIDIACIEDDELLDIPQPGAHTSTTIDPYDMLRLLRPLDPNITKLSHTLNMALNARPKRAKKDTEKIAPFRAEVKKQKASRISRKRAKAGREDYGLELQDQEDSDSKDEDEESDLPDTYEVGRGTSGQPSRCEALIQRLQDHGEFDVSGMDDSELETVWKDVKNSKQRKKCKLFGKASKVVDNVPARPAISPKKKRGRSPSPKSTSNKRLRAEVDTYKQPKSNGKDQKNSARSRPLLKEPKKLLKPHSSVSRVSSHSSSRAPSTLAGSCAALSTRSSNLGRPMDMDEDEDEDGDEAENEDQDKDEDDGKDDGEDGSDDDSELGEHEEPSNRPTSGFKGKVKSGDFTGTERAILDKLSD
ncbi:hypothetical protein RSOL_197880, partial [Rhizoctonia solani AG-3 Rhs1AP]